MIPFSYVQPASIRDASDHTSDADSMAIAGGTTMIDLMKLNVLKPTQLVHVRDVLDDSVSISNGRLVIGAGCTMSKLANHDLVRNTLPAIRQSLILAASPQIRNMATIGGNLLQRTRSTYFRHTDMPLPDDADPITSLGDRVDTSLMAVLGNGGKLVGMYPGDFAVTVVAFNGEIELSDGKKQRTVRAREFYQVPSDTFQYSTAMEPGELITKVTLPITDALKNSLYYKVRERSSYAFALASASVGLVIDGDKIVQAHVGLGGLGSIPWHSPEAEQQLVGNSPEADVFQAAADAALQSADPPSGLEYKVPLAKRTLVRALTTVRDHGPLNDQQLWATQHGRT